MKVLFLIIMCRRCVIGITSSALAARIEQPASERDLAIAQTNLERHSKLGFSPPPYRRGEPPFVTLDRSAGFHDRSAYHDYAVSRSRFLGQTQNIAGPDTTSGKRYVDKPNATNEPLICVIAAVTPRRRIPASDSMDHGSPTREVTAQTRG